MAKRILSHCSIGRASLQTRRPWPHAREKPRRVQTQSTGVALETCSFSAVKKSVPHACPAGRIRSAVGQALSGSRGETGNHEVAGKSAVMTLAARPRNHENRRQVKGLAAFFVAVHAAKERKENREPVERVSSRASIFRTASADCLPSRRRLKAQCSVDSGSSRTAIGRGNSALRTHSVSTNRRKGRMAGVRNPLC